MARRRRVFAPFLLFVMLAGSAIFALWLGMVPQRWSPFSPLSLELKEPWFLDVRLAALRRDPALCQSILKAPHIEAAPIADRPFNDRCGWSNAVRVSSIGGAGIGVEPLTCEMAAALTFWVEHELQPLAMATFGKRITGIEDMGTYDCRNIIGNPFWKNVRSEHAKANALDIAGFTLEGGQKISVLKHWKGDGPEATFLKAAHRKACRYFRVALGPEFNAAHRNHFHLDRGFLWTCR